MKIRSIRLENVRRFTDPVRVDRIGDGLNVLCEPNEHGKSTLFDALQAVFFKAHGSRDKDINALRPHAGGAPEVSVDIETGAGLFTVTKRWLQKPVATVHRGDTLVAQSDAAEAWVSDLLGGDAGGPSGLIWVRQGMTGLTGGSKKEQDAALEARRDLMTSVGEEVEAMTGGRRMDAALARCREELANYATGTGRPKANGPWKEAQDHVSALGETRDALAATARDLQEALAERIRARRDLAEWEAPEAVADRRERLEAARMAHQAAERHAEQVAAAARKVEMAQLTVDNIGERLKTARLARAEQSEAAQRTADAEAVAKRTRTEIEAARVARDQAEIALKQTAERLERAEAARSVSLRAQAARDGAERRADLEARIARAETLRQSVEKAQAASGIGPDTAILRTLEARAAAHAAAIAARDAGAPQLVARYDAGRTGTIRIGGAALDDGIAMPLPRMTTLEIEGIGTLDVHPGDSARDDAVSMAAKAYRRALEDAGTETLEDARKAAAARAEAERQLGEAKAALAGVAPDGITKLREALAAIPQPEDAHDQASDPVDAEAEVERARAENNAAQIVRETANERLADAREAATGAETMRSSLLERLKRAEDVLTRLGETGSEDALALQYKAALAALEAAQSAHAEQAAQAPDLANTAAALARADSVEKRAREEVARLRPLVARLDERISRSSGDAVEERLAETEDALVAAQADLDRIEKEVAVLLRLQSALESARNDARERYFAPIAQELKPLLHLLWPEAELTWGEESLLPDALVRDGQTEAIDVLSGGTQEQVALLVRLAFARMLATADRSAPVILDDALVYTDDDRIERMFDALHRQASDLQIIVLTCRQRAFRNLGGNALRLAR